MNNDLSRTPPQFRVFTGKDVHSVLVRNRQAVIAAVEDAYRAHHRGLTVNPDSYFLLFPDNAANRIIALPAHFENATKGKRASVTGIKWISSFPANVELGMPRASAVLVMNDGLTGYPVACMEASIISAARTAASAVSALKQLCRDGTTRGVISVIGTGLISRYIVEFILDAGIEAEQFVLHDLNRDYAHALATRIADSHGVPVEIATTLEDAMRRGDIVVFATTAGEPYVFDPDLISHNPIVLHISLRDLALELILRAHNVVDDVDHCLKARTSLHLAEMLTGSREFVSATLPAILCGAASPPPGTDPSSFLLSAWEYWIWPWAPSSAINWLTTSDPSTISITT